MNGNETYMDNLEIERDHLRSLLWKVADAYQISTKSGAHTMVVLSRDLLADIESAVGYDEMGQ